MRRFTSEEVVLSMGAEAGDSREPECMTPTPTCPCCPGNPVTRAPQPKPPKRDALASRYDLLMLQRQMAAILGG